MRNILTDTEDNLRKISDFLGDERVELLPYNPLAAAKYKSVSREFSNTIDASKKNEIDLSIFKNATLRKL